MPIEVGEERKKNKQDLKQRDSDAVRLSQPMWEMSPAPSTVCSQALKPECGEHKIGEGNFLRIEKIYRNIWQLEDLSKQCKLTIQIYLNCSGTPS